MNCEVGTVTVFLKNDKLLNDMEITDNFIQNEKYKIDIEGKV